MSDYIVKVQKNTEAFETDNYPIPDDRTPMVETTRHGELWVTSVTSADIEDEDRTETLVATYAPGAWLRAWIESDTTADPS